MNSMNISTEKLVTDVLNQLSGQLAANSMLLNSANGLNQGPRTNQFQPQLNMAGLNLLNQNALGLNPLNLLGSGVGMNQGVNPGLNLLSALLNNSSAPNNSVQYSAYK